EVEVQAGGVVALDDEARLLPATVRAAAGACVARAAALGGAGGFIGARAFPLLPVVAELVLGHGGCLLAPASHPGDGCAPGRARLGTPRHRRSASSQAASSSFRARVRARLTSSCRRSRTASATVSATVCPRSAARRVTSSCVWLVT